MPELTTYVQHLLKLCDIISIILNNYEQIITIFISNWAFIHYSQKVNGKMLSAIIVGLSLIASAIGTLATEIYVAKRVSRISANLNHRNC